MALPPLHNRKILLVDSAPSMVNIARSLLKKEGAHVVVAGSMSKGVQELGSDKFDILITERELPDGDGLDFVKKASDSDANKNTPVVMFTGITESAEIQKSIQSGAKGYIVKPFTPQNFMKQINKVLGTS